MIVVVANRFGPIGGRQYTPGEPIVDPITDQEVVIALLRQQVVKLQFIEPQATEASKADEKGARSKRK